MLDGYTEAITEQGVIELFNNSRTFDYARALGIRGVKACGCACSARLACNPGPYICEIDPDDPCLDPEQLEALGRCGSRRIIPVTPDSPGAPWWDERIPGSFDFAGAYVLGSSGWYSNSGREVTQNALSGSTFGAYRRDGRCITYDLVLIARSEAGLEFGVSYYDALLEGLGDCGFFTLGTAVDCPPGDCLDEELDGLRRYLRRVTVGSGIDVISTTVTGCCKSGGGCGHFVDGGGVYAQVQITLCSEQPWIYTNPECVVEACTFDPADAVKGITFLGKDDQEDPIYETRDVLTSRPRFKVNLTRDGQICKVGDWDWSETQYGGGTGVVVLEELIETPELNLTQIQEEITEEDICDQCDVILYYDVNNDTANFPQGPYWFEAINWSHSPGEPLPCGCEMNIIGAYVRNDSYDPEAEPSTDPTRNSEWSFINVDSGDTSGSCCRISLNFTDTRSGTWSPIGSEPSGLLWDPAGRDPLTGEQNFPPRGCSVVIDTDCEEEEEINLTYWEGAADGFLRVSVQGPVTYNSDGSWVSADGIEGCLPNTFCSFDADLDQPLIPKVENSDAFDICEGKGECPVALIPDFTKATDGEWVPATGWFHDTALQFPDPGCRYFLDREQDESDIIVQEQYEVSGGTCDLPLPFTKIFPSFASDCWEPVLIPNTQFDQGCNSCYCQPVKVVRKCTEYTNPSSTYCAVGSFSIRAGQSDLKNFRIRGWNSLFDSEVTPCEDCDAWTSKTPDFTLEVPHIPAGSILRIDSEARRGTLEFPGGRVEPAIRYVSGNCGSPFEYMELGPCETVYLLMEASPYDSAPNLEVDVCFSNYYGASGALLPS